MAINPCFQIMEVPTTGALQGINKIVRNKVFHLFEGRSEMISAKNNVITRFRTSATAQKNIVFFKESQKTASFNILL